MNTAPYGTWTSPLDAAVIGATSVTIANLRSDGAAVYWQEMRPTEAGRTVLVRRGADGRVADITPPPLDVGSRVHEYGGGAYVVDGRRIVIVDRRDNAVRLILLNEAGEAAEIRLIAAVPGLRFADFDVDPRRNRVACIREDHRAGSSEPINTVVLLDLSGATAAEDNAGYVVAQAHDFYMAPRFSPDGERLAVIAWDHPNMPWDATELLVAGFDKAGSPQSVRVIAGGPDEAIAQPVWSPDGVLHCVSDRSGWGNLCRWEEISDELVGVLACSAEFAQPAWIFGRSDYVFLADGAISCLFVDSGIFRQGLIRDGALQIIGEGASSPKLPAADGFVHLAHTALAPIELILEDALPGGARRVLRRAMEIDLPPLGISIGETITFETDEGGVGHAFFYAPKNTEFAGSAAELPPLVVYSHGGPTGMATRGFSPSIQFWTSRGFAVLDVNYGGSAGFGRSYRRRLNGRWGEVDVADCVAAARHMAGLGRVDPARMAIRGNSAGGYTTLAALTFADVFRAGASYYGVGDLIALARDTHKFELRYLDGLIGPLPEAEALYRARSPVNHLDGLNCPIIFFQGLDDKVVPPNQAAAMVAAMRRRGLPAAHYEFAGEGHGFRQSETIRRTLELELAFYGSIFGFIPAGTLERVVVE